MIKSNFLILFLLLLLLFRVGQAGIEPRSSNPELEQVESLFDETRVRLSLQAEKLLPQTQAALLSGMVVGEKGFLPSEFKQALRNTSTIHIVVVSGQNLTLLGGFILSLAPLIGRKKAVAVSMITILFYAVLTGFQVPVIRAGIMVTLGSAALLFNREGNTTRILLITGLLMLIFKPQWIYSISFQLSFLATVGVVVLAPELISKLKFIPDILRQDLGVSISAQLLTLPVIAANFHQVSLIGILVNSLILWTVPFIMISGVFALVVSSINLFLGSLASLVPGVLLTYFVYIVSLFNTGWSSLYLPSLPITVWIGYYLMIIGMYLMIKKNNAKNPLDKEN